MSKYVWAKTGTTVAPQDCVHVICPSPDSPLSGLMPFTELAALSAAHTGTTGAGPRRSALITLPSSLSVPCTSSGGVSAIQRLSETSA